MKPSNQNIMESLRQWIMVAMVLLAADSGFAQTYSVVDLGAFTNSPETVNAINNAGKLAGMLKINGNYRAVLYGGAWTNLGTLGGTTNTDALGTFAGIPIVTQTVNAVNHTHAARGLMEKALGVDKDAWLPDFATRKFRSNAKKSPQVQTKDGERTPGKVAIYATCYVNFNEPGIGHDLLAVLAHNDIPYELVSSEACCGMPLLEQGNLQGVAAKKEKNMPVLARYARDGYAIIGAIPSCVLMYKHELPLMFPDDLDVRAVSEAFWDPFEYFMARHRDGLLKTDFNTPLGKVSYHVPCHARVQNIGRKTSETFALVPDTQVTVVERCSGHAGTFGVKKEFHAMAMKIGTPVFKAMAQPQPDYISSDCQLAGHHIEQGFDENSLPKTPLAHPLTLLRKAYGL